MHDMEPFQQPPSNPAEPPRPSDDVGPLVSAPTVAEDLDVTRRTLGRSLQEEELEFPKPIVLNNRLYFRQREINTWKLERARLSASRKAV
jgi:predicted DNA-binding transcriptional regulator AlpA